MDVNVYLNLKILIEYNRQKPLRNSMISFELKNYNQIQKI